MIPYIIEYDYSVQRENDYDATIDVNDFEEIVKNTMYDDIKKYIKSCNDCGTFEDFCEFVHNEPYEDHVYFTIKFFISGEWRIYDTSKNIESLYNNMLIEINKTVKKRLTKKETMKKASRNITSLLKEYH